MSLIACEPVFHTEELASCEVVVAYCPEWKLLPACLTCKFSGQGEDWIFISTSRSENVWIDYLEECMQLGSVCWLFKTARRYIVLLALFNVSYGDLFSCSPLWFYTGSWEVENSSYTPAVCFVRWLSAFSHGVKCHVFWRLLKLIRLVYFLVDVLVLCSRGDSGEAWRFVFSL